MKNFIKTIKIKNFKCFNSFELEDLKRVNLIGGKNNMGKTAFMEACYLGLSTEDERSFFQSLLVLDITRNPLVEFEIIEDSNNFEFKFSDSEIIINDKIMGLLDFANTLYSIPQKDYNNGIKEITQFYTGKNKPLNIKNKTFISLNNIRDKFLIECIDEIKLQDKEDELNCLLKQLFNIEKIDVIKNRIMLKKDKKFILLSEFGDGVKHFLNIILALYLNQNSTIYLDEVESGIHYLLFDKLWEIILSLSKEKNVQVFATTHSKECIEAYYKVSKKLNEDNISFINLSKNKKDEIIGIVFDRDMFFSEIEQNHEVRVW